MSSVQMSCRDGLSRSVAIGHSLSLGLRRKAQLTGLALTAGPELGGQGVTMVMIKGGELEWVAVVDDGDTRETTEPFTATDPYDAWAQARALAEDQYDSRCRVVDVKQHTPTLDMVRRSKGLLACAAVALLAVSCGGGNRADTNQDQDQDTGPMCSDIWQPGATLPEGDHGCYTDDGGFGAVMEYDCDDGSTFITYGDLYAAPGGPIYSGSDKAWARCTGNDR